MAESDKAKNTVSQNRGVHVPAGARKGAEPRTQYRNGVGGYRENNMHPAPGSRAYAGGPQTKRTLPPTKKRKKSMLPRVVVIIVFSLLIVTFISLNLSHGKADALKGMWSYDAVTVYNFDGKGNGELILPSAQYTFTYSLKNDALHIDFADEKVRDTVYTFSIEKEDLTLTAADGETQFHLKRQ